MKVLKDWEVKKQYMIKTTEKLAPVPGNIYVCKSGAPIDL